MPDPIPQLESHLAARRSSPAKLFAGPVPGRSALERIIALALRVPDHGLLEPWRLIVLTRPDMQQLAAMAAEHAADIGAPADQIAKARGQYDLGQVAVVVISSPGSQVKVPLAEQVLSAGALCMNLLHGAAALGWDANWLTGWPAHDPVFTARAFGCLPGETVAGIIHIGTAGPQAPARPRPDPARKVQWGLGESTANGA